jgi:hypothetical protein
MAVLPTGIGPVTGGYQIERSLRFNSADSAYLNRTFASAGNRATWTWSAWVKRSFLDATATSTAFQTLFHAGVYTTVAFSADSIYFQMANGAGSAWYIQTSQVFRDPSAWYHIVAVLNTTAATPSQRMRLYINGVEVTVFSTDQRTSITLNTTSGEINNNISHAIGGNTTPARYFSGYQTEVNFIDGQALTPSDFGETDSNTGVWKPKAYTGTYGTNGFYLKFADNSGTTSTTLGKDSSGNGNNWTPNNFSVTAGAGNDSLVDSPTSYGTDTGIGGTVRGNYATFNALTTTGNTLTNGNLDAAAAAAAWRGSFSTIGVSSGKWYMEFTIVGGTFARQIIGIALNSAVNSASFYGYGFVSGGQLMGRSVGAIPVDYSSGTLTSLSPTTDFDNGDVVGLCIDADAGKLWVFKNNTIIEGTVNGTANVTWTANSLVFPVASMYSGDSVYANFGQRAFAYTAPSGFKALCTQNFTTPTIGATSTTQAGKYFNVKLYSGNGNTGQTITGVGFQPDFTWLKNRNQGGGYFHLLYDAVRGAGYNLRSDSTAAETNRTAVFSAFTSDGFTFPAGQGNTIENDSAGTYASWNWNAGGSTVTNTSGTISSQVRANTTSGFSIVTYTGTSANATVGHGLGVAPSMIIIKARTGAVRVWPVYHVSRGPGGYGYLNQTNAWNTDTTGFNNTSPTSTVFSLGNNSDLNDGSNFVAYCFADVSGYSKAFSYVSNNSADNAFVYLGFRPRWIMIKSATTGGTNFDWVIYDTARMTYNYIANTDIRANLTITEGGTARNPPIDILSNGFKVRGSGGEIGSSTLYVGMAFAETPFKYSLAR